MSQNLQTLIAFEVNKDKYQNDDNQDIEEKVETKQTEEEEEEEVEQYNDDVNPHFHEPLYIGNICTESSTERYYRWILFLSSSETEIIPPKSVKEVEYLLHDSFANPKRKVTKPPFFLDISGWGIFQVDLIIRFKGSFIRSTVETHHMISVDAPTSITSVADGTRQQFDKIFNYQKFKQFENESSPKKQSFAKKVAKRLKRNLLRTPAPIYFDHFNLTLSDFKTMFKTCISTENELQYINDMRLPEIIYDLIGCFAVFNLPLHDIMPNQEVLIEDCHNCEITISAPKFNHLRLQRCSNITITFPYIMSKCELIGCNAVNVICTGINYTYRFDGCNDINVQFLDPGIRTTFFCFDSPNVLLKCVGVRWKEERVQRQDDEKDNDEDNEEEEDYNDKEKYPDSVSYLVPYEKGEKERLSVRWRTSNKTPEWTFKVFNAKYTIGSMSRAGRN